MTVLRIERMGASDVERVLAMGHLFDDPPRADATRAFVASDRDHLLVAFDDADAPIGMCTATEVPHPDADPSLFINELGVDAAWRRQGVGRALTEAMIALGRSRGCVDVWVVTEPGNAGACATYDRSGGRRDDDVVMFDWELRDSEP